MRADGGRMRHRPTLAVLAHVPIALAILALAAGAPGTGSAIADPASTPPELESLRQGREADRRFTAQIEAMDPEAAELFRQANAARERADHARAKALYEQVVGMVPSFVHALRRQCHEELALGNREMAVALCRQAVRQQESADNLAALALALIKGTETFPSRMPDKLEAVRVATRAAELEPDNIFAATTLCMVALDREDGTLFGQCLRNLEARYPSDGETHYFAMIQAAEEGRFDEAMSHLAQARDSGLLDGAQYQASLKYLNERRRSPWHIASLLLPFGGIWLGLLGVLLVAGYLLSRLALRASAQVPSAGEGAVTGMDAWLRRVYRGVLWLCCGYYYVSIPIVVLLVLGVCAGTIYAFLWLGRIPVQLFVVLLLVTFYTLAAVARSLFVRGVDQDPGERLDLDRYPRLRAILEEVAQRVGTRPVDSVYLTPGAQVAVMERGRSLRALAWGRAERCLILGVAALDGLRLGPLKAVLAHEYGHFSNRDTAGGEFALAVRRSLWTMGQGIAAGGAATWYNPAWIFVNGFHRVFLRISQGASRLQEVLADRWAALSYGSRAFEEGLRHVVARGVRFGAHANATLDEVINAKRPLENLYSYKPERPPIERGVEVSVREALEAKPSPYDSHPSPVDRFAWVQAMNAPGTGASAEDEAEAWVLFPDRDAIERAMTAVVRRNVAQVDGIEIGATVDRPPR
jgi:Zn-dependent protease with chaperone function